jgi:hypothetical protein
MANNTAERLIWLLNSITTRNMRVLVECGDTGGTWSVDGIGFSEGNVVITLDKYVGIEAPETEVFMDESKNRG